MRQREQEILDTGTQIIWVLQDPSNIGSLADGEAADNFYSDSVNSLVGLRVGDDVTEPTAEVFQTSSVNTFRRSRGTVMVVRKRDMRIIYGSTAGGSVDALLSEIEGVPE